MNDRLHLADRSLEVARELRAAAEETRRTLDASRELVRRSRVQSNSMAGSATLCDDVAPSQHLVECLIDAYEAAKDEPDVLTRNLLGQVLHHVGCRIARAFGPKAVGLATH
ncbi:hypothetical protein [Methylobacterium sp. Leaf361]|uniref:hypothetical protein n=1 Tax=Methylobacterium sp. Leaf361 TaxID=1736352 RepID=UPI0012FEF6BE|nr:hypothetical protein [Methylobacterium sp. Leaf361]